MKRTTTNPVYTNSAGIGFAFLLIPIYFVLMSVTRTNLPVKYLDNPAIILGSIFLALAINLLAVVHLKFSQEESTVIHLAVKLKPANIAVIAIGLVIFGSLLSYAFLENFIAR